MIDFTSSLYLGMQHDSAELPAWHSLTTGKPAALKESPAADDIAVQVANLQGLENGCTAISTLHLYYDLYTLLSQQQAVVFIDEKVYPVSEYGIEKLLVSNVPLYRFRHLDALHLQQLVSGNATEGKQVFVITDGWCPQCGQPAPLNVYGKILQPYQGCLVIDDT